MDKQSSEALKEEERFLSARLSELTGEELREVTGGVEWYGFENRDEELEKPSRLWDEWLKRTDGQQ